MAQTIAIIAFYIIMGGLAYGMWDWDSKISPTGELQAPMDNDATKNVMSVAGLSDMMHVASYADRYNTIYCPIDIYTKDYDELVSHLGNIMPLVGWYEYGRKEDGTITVVMEENSLPLLAELADDPIEWVRKYQSSTPPSEFDGNFVNVRIYLDSYHGRSPLPLILFAVCLAVTVVMTIVLFVNVVLDTSPVQHNKNGDAN